MMLDIKNLVHQAIVSGEVTTKVLGEPEEAHVPMEQAKKVIFEPKNPMPSLSVQLPLKSLPQEVQPQLETHFMNDEVIVLENQKPQRSIEADSQVAMLPAVQKTLQQSQVEFANNLILENKLFREGKEYHKNMLEIKLQRDIEMQRHWLHQNIPKPLPITKEPDLDFKLTCFPPDMLKAAKALAARTGISVRQGILMIVGTIPMALRGRYIVAFDDWKEAVTTNVIVVSGPGTRKTQCIELLKEPFDSFICMAREKRSSHQETKQAYQALNSIVKKHSDKIFEKQLKAIDINDIEAVKTLVEQAIPQRKKINELTRKVNPAEPRIFVDSITTKKLPVAMSEQGECLACLDAEGAFIKELLSKKENTPYLFLKSHNYEAYLHEATNMGAVSLYAPAIQILLYIQPVELFNLLNNTNLNEKGGIARILPVVGQRERCQEITEFNPYDWDLYNSKIIAMLEHNFTQETPRKIYKIIVSKEASEHLLDFRVKVDHIIESNKYPYLEYFLYKLAGAAMRLAATLHCWRHQEPEKVEISAEDMQGGIILAKTFSSHAKYLYTPKGSDPLGVATNIIRWVQRWYERYQEGYFTNRQCLSGLHLKEVQIEPALELLTNLGYVSRIVSPRYSTINIFHNGIFNVSLS